MRELLTTIAFGALVATVVPAQAMDIRGPLSPSGGKSEAGSASQDHFTMASGSQSLVIPGDVYATPTWVSTFEDVRRSLSPASSDR